MTLKYGLAEEPQSLAFQLQEPGNVANFIPWKNTVQFDVQNKSFFPNYTFRVFTTLEGSIFRTAKSMFRRITAVKQAENPTM